MDRRTQRTDPYREVSAARTRRPTVHVVDTAAPGRMNPQVQKVKGRGYGKLLARQWAEAYQAQGFRVEGSSAHGFTVSDYSGVRGRIDVHDTYGAFGEVTPTSTYERR